MLPQFKNANIGPITDYTIPTNKAVPNSFYANKFCLLYTDALLQRAIWRAAAYRRKIEACKAAIASIEMAIDLAFFAGETNWHYSLIDLTDLKLKLNRLEYQNETLT